MRLNLQPKVIGLTILAVACVFFFAASTAKATSTLLVQQGGTSSTTLSGILIGNGLTGLSAGINTVTIGSGLSLTGTTLSSTGGISVPISIANGGTATTSAVTNGVYYYNGTNAEADTLLTFSTTGVGGGTLNTMTNGNGQGDTINSGGVLIGGLTRRTPDGSNVRLSLDGVTGRPLYIQSTNTAGTILDSGGGNAGINATSTPFALVSIAGSPGGTTPLFTTSSSTAGFATSTTLLQDSLGNITLGYAGTQLIEPIGSGGIDLYNTADQVTNYERLSISASNNSFNILAQAGGTGTVRNTVIGTASTKITIQDTPNTNGVYQFLRSSSTNGWNDVVISPGSSASSGTVNGILVSGAETQTGTAGYTELQIRPTETTLGSGSHLLIQLGTSTAPDLFDVDNTGKLSVGSYATSTFANGINLTGGGLSLGPTISGILSATAGAITAGFVNLASDVIGILPIANGGTATSTLTAFAVLLGGTTSTGALQQVTGTGSSGNVLTSNGTGAVPSWQAAGGGSTVTSTATTSSVSGSNLYSNSINLVSGDTITVWATAGKNGTGFQSCSNVGSQVFGALLFKQSTFAASSTYVTGGADSPSSSPACTATFLGNFVATTTQTLNVEYADQNGYDRATMIVQKVH